MTRRKKLELLRDELTAFEDEFDTSDSEWTQIVFKKHVSTLITKGVVKTRRLPRKLRLTELLEFLSIDKDHPEITEQAQEVDKILQIYGDEPTEEEMQAGRASLARVIELVDKALANERAQ